MDMARASLAAAPAFEEPASEESGKPHLRGCPVSFAKLKALLAADLYRYAGRPGFGAFAKHYAFTPGYKYTVRSEEHTSELQSLMRNSYAVFCLNKKKCPLLY